MGVVCLISICAFGKSPCNWLNICTIGCGHGGTMWLSNHLFSWTKPHWQQISTGRNSPGLVYISWGCWGQNHKGKERHRISRNKKDRGNKWALFQHLNGLYSFIKRFSSDLWWFWNIVFHLWVLKAKKSCQPLQQWSYPEGKLVNDFSVDNLLFQFLCPTRTIPTQWSILGFGLILNVQEIFWKCGYSLPPLDTEPAPSKMGMTGSDAGISNRWGNSQREERRFSQLVVRQGNS